MKHITFLVAAFAATIVAMTSCQQDSQEYVVDVQAHRRGMKVVTWTPDEKDEMQRLIDCGVDAIISNYPDRLLEVVKNQK